MDLTKPSTVHLAEALCHCDADPAGHRLDHPACAVVIRPGRYTRPDVRTIVEAAMSAPVVAALREIRAHARCCAVLDDDRPCSNRRAPGGGIYCGVHA